MDNTTNTKVQLQYFNIRGRAEVPRLSLEEAGIDYESLPVENWPELKQNVDRFMFGQLPILIEGDFVLPQSNAIIRHIARSYNLYGNNDKERSLIDAYLDGEEELRTAYLKVIYCERRGENFDEQVELFCKGDQKKYLDIFERALSKNKSNGWLVGEQLSVADIGLFELLDCIVRLDASALETYPLLKSLSQRIAERPRIAAYLKSDRRPQQVNGNTRG